MTQAWNAGGAPTVAAVGYVTWLLVGLQTLTALPLYLVAMTHSTGHLRKYVYIVQQIWYGML